MKTADLVHNRSGMGDYIVTPPKTLLQLANADLTPARLRDAALVLIDFQNQYLLQPLALPEAPAAIVEAGRLLSFARTVGAPVFHVAHRGGAGGLFDRDDESGQIVSALAPIAGEIVVEKGLPNSFANTDLHRLVGETGRRNLIIAGLMTHMCVSSTAREAVSLGYRVTIYASACASRDLPRIGGGIVDARTVHEVALSELSDRFAIIADDISALI